uniref:RanBP2-type domain-containing protein n=1 Tax=Monopterus albus TaxID=43700 RepID=A0A3Q3K797_MONAL
MALSSGGWAPPAPVATSSHQVACGGTEPMACCSTVLMSVRVSVCHSGIRPLYLPVAGSEALRLQLSMDPSRAGEFRLALRDTSGNRSVVRFHTSIYVFSCIRGSVGIRLDVLLINHLTKSHLYFTPAWAHTQPHSSCNGAAELSFAAAHWWVSPFTVMCFPFLYPKHTLKMPFYFGVSLLIEELCLELARAIEAGDTQAASQHASALAQQKAALMIQLSEKNYADGEISLSVVVEDVSSTDSSTLLLQVFLEYGFHPRVQRWVIGQCLCTEPRSLASYGVQKDGDTAYLYLISARQARITRQLFQQDLESALLAPPLPLEWACPSCTFINKPSRPGCEICATARPDTHIHPLTAGWPLETGAFEAL